jgi:hypothetical protein
MARRKAKVICSVDNKKMDLLSWNGNLFDALRGKSSDGPTNDKTKQRRIRSPNF